MRGAIAGFLAAALIAAIGAAPAQEPLRPYSIVGDAIPATLTGAKGDPALGRAIVLNRQVGLCLLCHSGPFPEERFQGNMAPDRRLFGIQESIAMLVRRTGMQFQSSKDFNRVE